MAAIPDPIFRIGIDGVYRGFKVDSELDLLTPPDQVIGRTVHQRLPRDVADAVLSAGRRAVDEQEPQHIEYTLEVRGEVRDYEGRVVASAHDEFVLIVRDFTDRTRQERVLERERDFSRAVVRSTPSFLALVDEDGILLGRQPRARACGRHSRGVLDRQPVLDAVHRRAGRRPGARGLHAPARRRPAGSRGVRARRRRAASGSSSTGRRRSCHDAEGRVRYLLCGLDVTARKQVEEEIRRSRARIVSAGDAERKRLERNLHDGAQQNLVSVSHAVHLAVRELRTDPDKAEEHLDRALTELTRAHEELRELARGLHPQILTLQGLGAAVRALAGQGADLRDRRDGRRRRALDAPRRERRVLRRLGGADQRAQVRESDVGDDPRRARATTSSSSRSPTTAAAARSRATGRASAGSATGWRRSTARSCSTARPAPGRASGSSFRSTPIADAGSRHGERLPLDRPTADVEGSSPSNPVALRSRGVRRFSWSVFASVAAWTTLR